MLRMPLCLLVILACLTLSSLFATAQNPAPAGKAPANSQAAPASGSSSPSSAAETGPTSEDSNEGEIIEHESTRIVFEADGTGTQEGTAAVRVQSQSGVKRFSVLAWNYLSSGQNLEVEYVRVRKPDGTVVNTPDYNVQDMPAPVSRSAPMYSDVHEKHAVVKGLAVGDVLEWSVRWRTFKARIPGQFWWATRFTRNVISRDELLEITVPRDKYIKLSSPGLDPVTKDDGPKRTYSWKHVNLQRPDPDVPVSRDSLGPDVQLTTFKSWEEVGVWYNGLQQPQVAVTPEIQARAAELTKGLTTDDAKMRALFAYVSSKFHYVSLSFGVGAFQPHPAEDVLENGYGDCKDKHTLLEALLKASGIEAWPALMNGTFGKTDPDMPSPAQFNHVITYVPRNGSPVWLDATPEVAPYQYLSLVLRGQKALVIPNDKPADLQTTPANPPYPRGERLTFNGKISSEGELTGHFQLESRGDSEIQLRGLFLRTDRSDWKSAGQSLSRNIGFGGDVSNVTASDPQDTTKPFEVSYDYIRKELGHWAEHRTGVPAPGFFVERAANQTKKPADPIELGALGELVRTATLVIQVGVLKVPKDVSLDEPYASYNSHYAMNGNTLTAERRLVIKQNRVPLSEWDAYKKFAKAIYDDVGASMELEPVAREETKGEKKTGGADATKEQPAAQATQSTSEPKPQPNL